MASQEQEFKKYANEKLKDYDPIKDYDVLRNFFADTGGRAETDYIKTPISKDPNLFDEKDIKDIKSTGISKKEGGVSEKIIDYLNSPQLYGNQQAFFANLKPESSIQKDVYQEEAGERKKRKTQGCCAIQ